MWLPPARRGSFAGRPARDAACDVGQRFQFTLAKQGAKLERVPCCIVSIASFIPSRTAVRCFWIIRLSGFPSTAERAEPLHEITEARARGRQHAVQLLHRRRPGSFSVSLPHRPVTILHELGQRLESGALFPARIHGDHRLRVRLRWCDPRQALATSGASRRGSAMFARSAASRAAASPPRRTAASIACLCALTLPTGIGRRW